MRGFWIAIRFSACRAAADDQHIKRVLGADLFGLALGARGVHLGQDFLQAQAAVAKHRAVEEHGGHAHDLALGDFVLEQAAFDHGGLDARVLDGHEVQCLHHVRAVVAGQRDVHLKLEVGVQCADLLQQRLLDLGRVAAHLQQGQHQRGELMPHGQAGKTRAMVFARAVHGERRRAVRSAGGFGDGDEL